MNKQELINEVETLREEGENDLRTVLYFIKQLDEPKTEECELNYIEKICPYDQDYDEEFYQCSNCEKTYLPNGFIDDFVYCPNCGRKINKGE